jgi:hypothetical protein
MFGLRYIIAFLAILLSYIFIFKDYVSNLISFKLSCIFEYLVGLVSSIFKRVTAVQRSRYTETE